MTEAGKIIITGTGRAGTTFLMQLLTELGLDTGYTRETWREDYNVHCAAGLERDLADPKAPRIVKSPAFCETLPALLAGGGVIVAHAIIPVRALDEAASSRIWIGGRGKTAGGLWGTTNALRQKSVLAENFHQLMHTLAVHDIPHTLLDFPRFARDEDYTRRKLQWLLADIDAVTFAAAFNRVSRPELIHNFSQGLPPGAGQATRIQRNHRWRRRARRLLLGGLVAIIAWIIYLWQHPHRP